MSRTNRRHTRAIERHRRNNGTTMLSRAADKKLETESKAIVSALLDALTHRHNTKAAQLLIELAESAENPALYTKAKSLAEIWAKEPQVVGVDIGPQIAAGRPQLLLGDGADAGSEVVEGEYEAAPGPAGP